MERLDATSVVDLIGKHDIDRVRMYAALLAEEGTIRELRGEAPRAQLLLQPRPRPVQRDHRVGRPPPARRLGAHGDAAAQVGGAQRLDRLDPERNTGLNPMEPLGRAFVRSVLEHPADGGLFGPHSIVWRVHRDRSFPLAGLRSLMVQALHPLAMAGVAEHSTWKEDPFGRLAATSGYILTVTYGDTAAAHQAASRVRAIHNHVNGTDPVTGLAYRAADPSLLLWIHAAMVDSIVHVVQRYGRGLDATAADRYVGEMVRFAELVGVAGAGCARRRGGARGVHPVG